jgi:hypothetical protein
MWETHTAPRAMRRTHTHQTFLVALMKLGVSHSGQTKRAWNEKND